MELADLAGKHCLVTGGTGFLGGRLVERLVLEQKADVTVLVRNFAKAVRIARFDNVHIVQGDFADPNAVMKAAEGCQFIFNCAHFMAGTFRRHNFRQNLRGTGNVAVAASQNNARLVHVSSVDAYGLPSVNVLDESCPPTGKGDFYSEAKRRTEQLLFHRHWKNGLAFAVVQPTVIYGPYAGWTLGTCAKLRSGRVVLPNEGKGRCNPVHVDDVIDAMMLAATKEEAIGQNFLISGPDNVSWEYWFRRHEKILGVRSLLLPSDAEFKRLVAQNERKRNLFPVIKSIFTDGTVFMLVKRLMQARLGEVCIKGTIKVVGDMLFMIPGCHHWDQAAKRIVRKLRARATASIAPSLAASDTLVLPADRHITRLYTSPTVVSIDKARTCLGYNPQYSFEDGMTSTDAFIKWASL